MRELEIALPQLPQEFIHEPQLAIEDIYAVQGLVMGYVRKRARTKHTDFDAKNHRMAMLNLGNEYSDEMYDGSNDTYMTCKVQKLDRDQWRMAVSFLDVVNTQETKLANSRRAYKFDWLKNGNRQAWYTHIRKERMDEGLHVQVLSSQPITSDQCLALQDEILEVTEAVNPISSKSILIPRG